MLRFLLPFSVNETDCLAGKKENSWLGKVDTSEGARVNIWVRHGDK